jgi:hypothetical protein
MLIQGMIIRAMINWTVFIFTAPLRLIGGAELHESAYRGVTKVISAVLIIGFVLIIIAAISGNHSTGY